MLTFVVLVTLRGTRMAADVGVCGRIAVLLWDGMVRHHRRFPVGSKPHLSKEEKSERPQECHIFFVSVIIM